MGLLDFLNTPQGQALASGVASYAATARRGTPVNNIGRGLLGGVTGYSNAVQGQQEAERQAAQNAYNQRMMGYNETQAETARLKAETERKKLLGAQSANKAAAKMYLPGFLKTSGIQGQGFDIDEQGEVVPVDMPNMQPISANLDWIDSGDDYKSMIAQGMQSEDPAIRRQAVKEAFNYYKGQKQNVKEAKDLIGKERAMAEAMNMPLGDYLRQKTLKSGQNININNVMPGNAAEAAGKKEGYEIGEQAAMIENKYSALDSVREAKDILQKGIYAGTYGDFQKKLAKGSFGAIGDRQKAINTEEFVSYIGNTVVPRLKEFGGNDSNEEMRYLKSIMGGDTSMEPEAIARIIDSAERKIQRGIERLQRQRGALETGKMPDLGPGPARGQKAPLKPAGLKQSPSVEDLLKKYGGK